MNVKKWTWPKVVDMMQDGTALRPRINLHDTFQDPAQHMIVVMRPGEERPPHANGRELTQIILYGEGELLIYDDAGNVVDRFAISPRSTYCYKLAAGVWHTRKIYSDAMVFVEILPGPYACHLPDVKEMKTK